MYSSVSLFLSDRELMKMDKNIWAYPRTAITILNDDHTIITALDLSNKKGHSVLLSTVSKSCSIIITPIRKTVIQRHLQFHPLTTKHSWTVIFIHQRNCKLILTLKSNSILETTLTLLEQKMEQLVFGEMDKFRNQSIAMAKNHWSRWLIKT